MIEIYSSHTIKLDTKVALYTTVARTLQHYTLYSTQVFKSILCLCMMLCAVYQGLNPNALVSSGLARFF